MNSTGGTYVNGQLIGRRPKDMERDEALQRPNPERDLKDGDELRLCKHGAAVFRVSVTVPAACSARVCARCGRDVAGEPGANRLGAFFAPTAAGTRGSYCVVRREEARAVRAARLPFRASPS